MKLQIWRESNGLTRESVAKSLGVHDAAVVAKWELGRQKPCSDMLVAIYELTGGDVQPNDFVNLPDLKQMRAA